MHANLDSLFASANKSIQLFNAWAAQLSILAQADHISFKCASLEEYEHMRRLFECSSTFVYQSIISKRRIAVIKFLEPLPTALGEISFLELSDQKPDQSQVSGFDHIEIYPKQGSVEDLEQHLAAQGVVFQEVVRPHHTTFDTVLQDGFKIRLESEPLLDKIKVTEML